MDYEQEYARGRAEVEHDLAAVQKTGNLPLLVRKIKEAAADESGFGVGYLNNIAGRALA